MNSSNTLSIEYQLLWACRDGKIDLVKELMKNEQIDINACLRIERLYEPSATPIIMACRANHIEIVKLLLNDKRIDVNKKAIAYDGGIEIDLLHEVFTNGSPALALLILCDNRIDKSDIFARIKKIANRYTDLFYRFNRKDEDIRLLKECLIKLSLLFADQKRNGLAFFLDSKDNSELEILAKAILGDFRPLSILNSSPNEFTYHKLSDMEKEFCLQMIACILFANKEREISFESLQSTLVMMVDKFPDHFRDFFNGLFNNFAKELANNLDLQIKLDGMHQLSDELDYFKSLPARIEAIKFAKVSSCFGGFNNLPIDLRHKIAGYFFAIPDEKSRCRINEKTIEMDEENFRAQCGIL